MIRKTESVMLHLKIQSAMIFQLKAIAL